MHLNKEAISPELHKLIEQAEGDAEGDRDTWLMMVAHQAYQLGLSKQAVTAQPVAWIWKQLMHDYMGGWETKIEIFPPSKSIKPEDTRDLTPLYASPQPTPVGNVLDPGSDSYNEVVGGMVDAMLSADTTCTPEDDEAWDMAVGALGFLHANGYLSPAPLPGREAIREALEAVPRTGNNQVDYNVGRALALLDQSSSPVDDKAKTGKPANN